MDANTEPSVPLSYTRVCHREPRCVFPQVTNAAPCVPLGECVCVPLCMWTGVHVCVCECVYKYM